MEDREWREEGGKEGRFIAKSIGNFWGWRKYSKTKVWL